MRKDGLLYVPSPETYPRVNPRRKMKPADVLPAYREAFAGEDPYRAAATLLFDEMELLNSLKAFGRKQQIDCLTDEIKIFLSAWDERGGKAV